MKPNRSIPPSAIIPVLTYPDVRQAVDWLCRVFGFEERVRIGENHRAQLAFGDGGGLIVADTYGSRQAPEGDGITHSVMVRVGDVTAHFEYARAEGAKIVSEPADFPFGERQYTVQDPAGHHWIFTETTADVAPEEWGGQTVNGGW
ncbi:MAG TPA: VOC family protein [Thermomicrobiaceae bacterium]|nr:VOC family protein [Thermomicrobiaceae bacterium]